MHQPPGFECAEPCGGRFKVPDLDHGAELVPVLRDPAGDGDCDAGASVQQQEGAVRERQDPEGHNVLIDPEVADHGGLCGDLLSVPARDQAAAGRGGPELPGAEHPGIEDRAVHRGDVPGQVASGSTTKRDCGLLDHQGEDRQGPAGRPDHARGGVQVQHGPDHGDCGHPGPVLLRQVRGAGTTHDPLHTQNIHDINYVNRNEQSTCVPKTQFQFSRQNLFLHTVVIFLSFPRTLEIAPEPHV